MNRFRLALSWMLAVCWCTLSLSPAAQRPQMDIVFPGSVPQVLSTSAFTPLKGLVVHGFGSTLPMLVNVSVEGSVVRVAFFYK